MTNKSRMIATKPIWAAGDEIFGRGQRDIAACVYSLARAIDAGHTSAEVNARINSCLGAVKENTALETKIHGIAVTAARIVGIDCI